MSSLPVDISDASIVIGDTALDALAAILVDAYERSQSEAPSTAGGQLEGAR